MVSARGWTSDIQALNRTRRTGVDQVVNVELICLIEVGSDGLRYSHNGIGHKCEVFMRKTPVERESRIVLSSRFWDMGADRSYLQHQPHDQPAAGSKFAGCFQLFHISILGFY